MKEIQPFQNKLEKKAFLDTGTDYILPRELKNDMYIEHTSVVTGDHYFAYRGTVKLSYLRKCADIRTMKGAAGLLSSPKVGLYINTFHDNYRSCLVWHPFSIKRCSYSTLQGNIVKEIFEAPLKVKHVGLYPMLVLLAIHIWFLTHRWTLDDIH